MVNVAIAAISRLDMRSPPGAWILSFQRFSSCAMLT
jgi:hypothetical protein